MLLGIQLALLAIGVAIVLRGRMGGAPGHDVVGVRARLAGLVIGAMAVGSIAMSGAPGHAIEAMPIGADRLGAIAVQVVWLTAALALGTLIAGQGRSGRAARSRRLAA